MKINEIIREGAIKVVNDLNEGHWDDHDPFGEVSDDERIEQDPFGELEDEPEMDLSSSADAKMVNAVKKVADSFKGQGHAQVELLPFLTKVIEIAKKPVNLADLIAVNKRSPEIRAIIDSIDEKKVKFKNMSVKNEDPAKAQEKKDATVSNMATRAMR